jgi:hypothetical protein
MAGYVDLIDWYGLPDDLAWPESLDAIALES